jgi:hypothetical protein
MCAASFVSQPSTTPPPLPPTSRAAHDCVWRLRHVWHSVNYNAGQEAQDMRMPLDTANRPQQDAIRYIAPRSGTPNDGNSKQKAIMPGNEHGETVRQELDNVERVSQVLEMTNGVLAVYKLYFLVSYASTQFTCILYILPHSSEALARNYPSHRPRGSYAPLSLSLRTSTITH